MDGLDVHALHVLLGVLECTLEIKSMRRGLPTTRGTLRFDRLRRVAELELCSRYSNIAGKSNRFNRIVGLSDVLYGLSHGLRGVDRLSSRF